MMRKIVSELNATSRASSSMTKVRLGRCGLGVPGYKNITLSYRIFNFDRTTLFVHRVPLKFDANINMKVRQGNDISISLTYFWSLLGTQDIRRYRKTQGEESHLNITSLVCNLYDYIIIKIMLPFFKKFFHKIREFSDFLKKKNK